MLELILTILITALLYLVPGYLVLKLVDLQGINRAVRFCLSLCLSLIIVPCVFMVIGNIYSFIPGGIPWLILVVFLLAAVWLVKYKGWRPQVQLISENGEPIQARWVEQVAVWGWIALFSLVALLPRLDMFLFGGSTLNVGTWDETWHLAQLVSVARTGLTPQHYLFPSISLSYYYSSWIYPAILGNLPWLQVSLARAMALQAYIQTFAFLGIVYCFLLANYKKWWVRIAGLAFFTVLGGFDLYASIAAPGTADWWQGAVGWLISGFQVSQFVTLYAWVPQHIAGGMAFIFCLLVWKNLNSPIWLKSILTALFLGFSFTTSSFVFLFFSLAVGLFALLNLKELIAAFKKEPKKILLYVAMSLVIFLLVTWHMIVGFSGRTTIGLSDMRVPVFETLIGSNRWSIAFDRLLIFLGFPLVASWIGLIEFGLPFILYLVWIIQWIASGKGFPNKYDALFAVYPPLCFLLVITFRDIGGGGNFAMRGLIPAQILIQFAALNELESVSLPRQSWKRLVIAYLIACFVLAQGASALSQVRNDSWNVVSETRKRLAGQFSESTGDPFYYVSWLNNHTPRDALILEAGCMTISDATFYRWLERSRYIMPECGMKMELFDRDRDFYIPAEWRQLKQIAQGKTDILELYQASSYWLKGKVPIYLVSWGNDPRWAGSGEMKYQDAYVSIYQLP